MVVRHLGSMSPWPSWPRRAWPQQNTRPPARPTGASGPLLLLLGAREGVLPREEWEGVREGEREEE